MKNIKIAFLLSIILMNSISLLGTCPTPSVSTAPKVESEEELAVFEEDADLPEASEDEQ